MLGDIMLINQNIINVKLIIIILIKKYIKKNYYYYYYFHKENIFKCF